MKLANSGNCFDEPGLHWNTANYRLQSSSQVILINMEYEKCRLAYYANVRIYQTELAHFEMFLISPDEAPWQNYIVDNSIRIPLSLQWKRAKNIPAIHKRDNDEQDNSITR